MKNSAPLLRGGTQTAKIAETPKSLAAFHFVKEMFFNGNHKQYPIFIFYPPPLVYNNANTLKATAITIPASYSSILAAADYGAAVVTINASARTKAINITGNAKNNVIIGGSGADTLAGGAGNDTLTGGGSKDVFIYSAGNDVIKDYAAAQDTIKIASGSISSYNFNGDDAVFKIGSNTLKVTGGKSKAITLVDSKKNSYTYQSGLIHNNATASKATALTVTAAFEDDSLSTSSYGASVVTINAAARTKAVNITGNAKNNVIIGGSGNDTLGGGKGNDTLRGGSGSDVFIYSGGNDVIADYEAGKDTIQIAGGSISSYSFSGSDVSFKVGSNTIKIKNAKADAVTVVDSKGSVSTYQSGLIYSGANVAKAAAMTVTALYGKDVGAYGASIETIDASARTAAVNITGNAAANYIIGGKKADTIDGGSGNDTLIGGLGNDTLIGGAGNNVFVYANGDGNDVITDYTEGKDRIKLTSGSVSAYSVKGDDAIIKIGKGALTLKGAGASAITIVDAADNLKTYAGGLIYNSTRVSRATAVTLTADFSESEFGTYGASIETINASARTTAIEITGNTGANFISGGAKNDTIDGGKGDDTIQGGKGSDILAGGKGFDVFLYSNGDGSDTITDYAAGEDIISLASGSIGGYSVKGDDAVFKIGSGNITVADGADVAITIVGSNGTASIYSGGDVSTKKWTGFSTASGTDTVYVTLPAETVSVTVPAETVTVGGGDTVTVTVNGGGEFISGTSGDDTLTGTAGNDTISLGAGNDVYIYEGGGDFDVVVDYAEGADKISIGTNSVGSAMLVGADVIFAINGGILKLDGAKDKKVTIISGGSETEYVNGAIPSSDTGTSGSDTLPAPTLNAVTVTLEAGRTSDFSLSAYNATATPAASNINASLVTTDRIWIYGDDNENIIWGAKGGGSVHAGGGNDIIYCSDSGNRAYGGTGNDTIYGGKSTTTINPGDDDDVVYCGTGADMIVFYSDGGSDVVYDFKTGDRIVVGQYNQYDDSSFRNFSLNGDDVILNLTSGANITLKDAKDQRIYIGGYSYNYNITFNGSPNLYYYNSTFGKLSISGGTASLDADYAGNFYMSLYADNLANANASNVQTVLSIYGDSGANVIHGGKAETTIYAGKGDDTIYAGNGVDLIYYYTDDGDETVYNFKTGDKILLKRTTAYDDMAFENISLRGDDVILNLNTGNTITLKDARDQRISVAGYDYDESTSLSYRAAYTYNNTFGMVTISGDSATLGAGFAGIFNTAQYAANPSNINASLATNEIAIYGDNKANTIYGGRATTTIHAGKGNDVIYCGNGTDVIFYETDDGNETVYNFKTGDKILLRRTTQYDDMEFENVSLSGNDVIINLNTGNTITLKDAKDQRISVAGYDYNESTSLSYRAAYTYNRTFGLVTISGSSATLGAGFMGTLNTAQYAANPSNINASMATNEIAIYGDDRANTIYGGRAATTIYAGKGNDVIYCGNGTDLIYYYTDDGNETVYNYKTGDKILLKRTTQYDDMAFENVSLSGDDVIINLNTGNTITLKDAKDQRISIESWEYNKRPGYAGQYALYTYNNTFGKVSISGGTASLKADYAGNFSISSYAADFTNINASAVSGAVNIHGNAAANVIRAGKAGGSIFAGEGNDTIYCGDGRDSIVFYSGDGNDTVYNIGNNDAISLSGCSAESVTVSGADVIITTDDNEKITLKDGAGKSIWISGKGTQTYTSVTSSADILNDIDEDVPWFAEDDNFMGADLDSLLDDGNSLANLSLGAFDHDSILPFAQDKTPAYSFTNEK